MLDGHFAGNRHNAHLSAILIENKLTEAYIGGISYQHRRSARRCQEQRIVTRPDPFFSTGAYTASNKRPVTKNLSGHARLNFIIICIKHYPA